MVNLLDITKKYVFNLLLDGLIILYSLICSYPIYILYLCYFTPYILKIVCFLYPLFITTSLLVISLATAISTGLVNDTFLDTESPKLQTNSLLSIYDVVSRILQLKFEDEYKYFHSLEALEIYNIVFDTSMLDDPGANVDIREEYPEEKILKTVETSVLKIPKDDEQHCVIKAEEALKGDTTLKRDSSIDGRQLKSIKSVIKKFEDLLKKSEESEFISCKEQIKAVQTEINQTFDKQNADQLVEVVHNGNSRLNHISKSKNPQSTTQNTRTNITHPENNSEFTSKDKIIRQRRIDIGRYGSMSKEREWRSTLACKLFEEKHNSTNIEGIEGMDLLWEKYDEGDSMNTNTKKVTTKIVTSKFKNMKYEYGEDEDEDEDEDNDVGVNLCCLYAFKLSATKMNMGVGRRNLSKISKAIKRLGWMHKANKQNKKVHNNNGETLQFP